MPEQISHLTHAPARTPAIEDVDAVVSSIGGSVADPSADSTGNINIIEAAAKKGVKKFVLVGSTGSPSSAWGSAAGVIGRGVAAPEQLNVRLQRACFRGRRASLAAAGRKWPCTREECGQRTL
jgi:hypothetical protein